MMVPIAKEFSSPTNQDDMTNPPPNNFFQASTASELLRRRSFWEYDIRFDTPDDKLNQPSSPETGLPLVRFNTPTPLLLQNQQSQTKVIATRGFSVLIAVLILFIGISSASGYMLGRLTPTMSLVEATHGTIGDMLHLHGQNFLAGTKVVLTRDASVPLDVTVRETYESEQTQNGVQIVAKKLATLSGNTLTLGNTGTFDITMLITKNWSTGSHSIRASELGGLFSTEISITVALPPKSNA